MLDSNELVWEHLTSEVKWRSASALPSANALKYLQKWSKKTKGMFNAALARECFKSMPGWKMEDTKTPLLLNGMGPSDVPKEMLKDWARKNDVTILGALSKKEPFEFLINTNDRNKAEKIAKDFERQVKIVGNSGPGGSPSVGTLYATRPSPPTAYYGDRMKFVVGQMYLGLPGWIFSAPSGQKITLPNPVNSAGRILNADGGVKLTPFWTWAYKNGLDRDAQKALDSFDQEDVAYETSGRAKRDQVRQEYSAEVEKLLKQVVSKKHKEVVAGFEKAYVGALDRFMAAHDASIKAQKEKGDKYPSYSMYAYFKERPHEMSYKAAISAMTEVPRESIRDVYVRKSGWKTIAKERAESQAVEIRDAFVGKNTFKLGRIVNSKGDLKEGKVLSINSGADYGGELMFTFNDGTSFTVRNKTVIKQNMHGTVFAQYPTTFHDVVLPDGSKMSSPSEKRMVEVFAKA